MKDLTKELYFTPQDATTISEIKRLFEMLLDTTWSIDIYKGGTSRVINLKQLGWKIEYNNAKRAAGKCKWGWRRNGFGDKEVRYGTKKVLLSMHYMKQNLEEGKAAEWEEVIRHELAHAMDVEIRGKSNHDNHWKAVAREMLSSGRVTFSKDELKDEKLSKYTLKCVEDDCDYTRKSHKKRKENARSFPCCTTCYNAGKGYKRLVQVQNY